MSQGLFDTYSLRARQVPTLLVVAPHLAIVALIFPAVYETAKSVLTSLGLAAILLLLLSQALRARGRALEKHLYERWGGIPTTIWLRHSDQNLDSETKARYRAFLQDKITGLTFPSDRAEQSDPEKADQVYASAAKWLLEHTRDAKKYPLVFEENVSYGFRRNLRAGKPVALAGLSILLGAILLTLYVRGHLGYAITNEELVAGVINVATILIWMLVVTKEWVKDAAYAYARALLASCDMQ